MQMLVGWCILLGNSKMIAQSTIGAASGKGSISNQLHEWSVGEMCAISTVGSPVLLVTQGFLQPQGVPVSTKDAEATFAGLRIIPNPTLALASISGSLPTGAAALVFKLFDSKGTLLEMGAITVLANGQIDGNIDLTAQPAGTYFLQLQTSGSTKTLSIVKL